MTIPKLNLVNHTAASRTWEVEWEVKSWSLAGRKGQRSSSQNQAETTVRRKLLPALAWALSRGLPLLRPGAGARRRAQSS